MLATNFWSAKKGRDALKVEWDEAGAFKLGSAEILAQYKKLAEQAGRRRAQATATSTKAFAGAREDARGGVRVPVSRARGDGADELRRAA